MVLVVLLKRHFRLQLDDQAEICHVIIHKGIVIGVTATFVIQITLMMAILL